VAKKKSSDVPEVESEVMPSEPDEDRIIAVQETAGAAHPAPNTLKILIAIPTCKADGELEDACRKTWASQSHVRTDNITADIVFFDGETLGVGDSYEELPIKVQAICKWALEKVYDFLFKCDSDTYVWLDRLLASGFERHNYSGYTNPNFPDSENYCSGGAGYWLSAKAMEVIAGATLPADTCEDRVVGRLLYDAGIKLHRNPLHAHGRHEEAKERKVLTMHPCRSLAQMGAMRDA